MGRATICGLVAALGALAVAITPAPALAGKGSVGMRSGSAGMRSAGSRSAGKPKAAERADAAATEAYIQADYALVRTARANMQTGEAALVSLQQTLGAECPEAAAASPENEAAEHLSNEVIGAMSTVFIRSDVQAVADFAEAVTRLHWSDQKLTHKVGTYAAKLKALAALEMPAVCGDVRAWAASGYRALPASTTQFDQRFSAEDVGIGEVPARLLAPYESSHERSALTLTKQFENELVDAEARAVEPWSKILNALDLQP